MQSRLQREEPEIPNQDPEKQWVELKAVLQKRTAEVDGFSTRKIGDWFNENDSEIQELLQKQCNSQGQLLAQPDDQSAKAAYSNTCSTLHAKLKDMQNN